MVIELARNWWTLALRGLAAIVFGVVAWIWPDLTVTALVLLFGAYALVDGLAWLELPLDAVDPGYPDLARMFPCATRMQRAIHDLLGHVAAGAVDTRPWL